MSGTTQQSGGISPGVLARYEPVIGLEVHLQLKTASKIFCSCSTRFGDAPNRNTCPVCLGLPGALPVLNRGALELAIRAALALHSTVQERSRFARKNYFYPDLPKGYQISMYEMPLATGGWLEIPLDGATKRIGITRLHMEDDAAKNLHEGFPDSDRNSYIDFNRCGVPLVEIVSEPDIRSPEEAYAYLTMLKQVLEYTDVSDCNMEEGSLRCDANVSVRRRGEEKFGVKAEVKNLNSFRYLQRALEFEIERQIGVLESGARIEQETRLWNVTAGQTEPMRSKEFAHDYRYFPEPDLLPVHVSEKLKTEILAKMPELPGAKRARFKRDYSLSDEDASFMTATVTRAELFENSLKAAPIGQSDLPFPPPEWLRKSVAKRIRTDLMRQINESGTDESNIPIKPEEIARLEVLIHNGQITEAVSKKVFRKMFETGKPAQEIIAEEDLGGQTSKAEIERIAREVVESDPANFEKYRFGKDGILKSFVGRIMKETNRQAPPELVHDQLRLQHEKAVAQSFAGIHPDGLKFLRFGVPPEPDLLYHDKNGQGVGIEITTTYLNKDEAKAVWQQALTGEPAIWSSGVITSVDETYFELLIGAILKKKTKTYSVSPTWLVVDFDYPLGDRSDAENIAAEAAKKVASLTDWPFQEIWAVWRVTNVATAQYEIFRIF